MEQLTTRIGIEPGPGLVGRFGDTVIVIPRGRADSAPASAGTVQELLGLAAEVGSDRQAPANAIASRLAAWVIGHMSGDAPAFGIVAPMRDGVVMFLRGAVWCTITEGGSTREVSGEQAFTWVDLIVPGTFEQLAIGSAAGRPVQADPLSDLRAGVVPGQGFVLSRTAGVPGLSGAEPALAEAVTASEPEPAAAAAAPAAAAAAACGRLGRLRLVTVRGDTGAADGPAGGGLGAPGRAPELPARARRSPARAPGLPAGARRSPARAPGYQPEPWIASPSTRDTGRSPAIASPSTRVTSRSPWIASPRPWIASPRTTSPRPRTTSRRWSCGPANTTLPPARPSQIRPRPFCPPPWARCHPGRRRCSRRSAC